MNLHVIIGPPAAGKTTYVAQHRKPGDIAIDLDHIANTLAGLDQHNHDHQAHILVVAKAARQAAIDAARKQKTGDVWLIHTRPSPSQMQHYADIGARIHIIDPGKDVVMHRCKTMRTKGAMIAAVNWYDHPPATANPQATKPKTSTDQRGYGWRHQKRRRVLLAQLKDGSPCPECGQPMYKQAERNFDHAALEADHGPGNALKYADNKQATKATRLLHRTCNRSGGAWDKPRPARQAPTGPSKPGGFIWG